MCPYRHNLSKKLKKKSYYCLHIFLFWILTFPSSFQFQVYCCTITQLKIGVCGITLSPRNALFFIISMTFQPEFQWKSLCSWLEFCIRKDHTYSQSFECNFQAHTDWSVSEKISYHILPKNSYFFVFLLCLLSWKCIFVKIFSFFFSCKQKIYSVRQIRWIPMRRNSNSPDR